MKNNKKEDIDLTGLEILEEKKQVTINIDSESLSSTDTEATQWNIILERNRKRQKLVKESKAKFKASELSDSSDSFISYSGEAASEDLKRVGRDYQTNLRLHKQQAEEEEEVIFIKVIKPEVTSGIKLYKHQI